MRITVIRKDGITKKRSIKAGSPFAESVQQRASFDCVHWYDVFVNGEKVLPNSSPDKVEAGMDIVIVHEDVSYEPR